MNSHFRKGVSFFLCLCLSLSLFTSLFSSTEINPSHNITWEDVYAGVASPEEMFDLISQEDVPAAVGYNEALKRGHVKRLYSEETGLNTALFQNADGTKTLYTFDYPIKYVAENGSICDISLSIFDSKTDGVSYRSEKRTHAFTQFFSVMSDGIRLEGNSAEIKLIPLPEQTESKQNYELSRIKKLNDKTVSYRYDRYTTLEYSLTYNGFKEDIVVSEYTGQTEYQFELQTNRLIPVKIDGEWYLTDSKNEIKASIGNIIIFTADERNNGTGTITIEEQKSQENYLLTIHIDPDYLSDPKTHYPIRIDPTIEINASSATGSIEDVTINQNTGSAGSSTSLYIGCRNTYGITRILMRFPNLNLSAIPSAENITSATVSLRDLMCQTEEMNILCYVFNGNNWTESTAEWSNVAPSNYSALLSSNTVSYSNGTAQQTAHWYPFDITNAVKGWKVGSYSQGKGILFKASNTIESAGPHSSKTFASFNRASYKPYLVINYTTGSSSGQLSDGTYYLNNKQHGQYLKHNGTSITSQSGMLANLGTSIRWELQRYENNYVIHPVGNSSVFLAVPDNTSSNTVTTYTSTGSALPSRCIWTLSAASNGGGLLKNTYNSKYLYCSGNSVYTSLNTGSVGTSTYYSHVWRIASTSYYGNGSSYDTREVTAGTYISHVDTNVGKKKTPTISKYYSNEAWCSASDFTYSGYSSIISIDPLTGRITAKGVGNTTVTAVHKVTAQIDTFTVSVSTLLIYQSPNTYYQNSSGNYPEDLEYNDLSQDDLSAIDWISASDFTYTPAQQQAMWEDMCTTLFSTGDMEDVILEMIDHFMDGSGTPYSNDTLTQEAYAHSSTQTYISTIESKISTLLNTYDGNITALEYLASDRESNPLVVALQASNTTQPVYNTLSDRINGLQICVNDLWGNKIEVSSFNLSENTYTCTLHYTLYDHFGLDQSDVAEYGYLAGFRYWYILQHYSGYNGAYCPFLTLIEFDVPISGTYS